ncbi:uncharacterized protein LOC126852909 [Cataglyphis hispanica]|uniref:uncharacterized protein LOC126852909 n=1 Tax=Cataglyphis hispanica TaxID=1086592 RepID=UPI00217F99D0|nr:uncharacterized protein LOC126852909 [Cataglyphis hispanica]
MDEELNVLVSVQCWTFLLMLFLAKMQLKKKRIRRCVCSPLSSRETQGIYRNLFRELRTTDHEEFFGYTRMNVQQFDYIYDLVRPYLIKRSIRTSLPLQLRVAFTIEMLARGTSIRTSSWNYRIGRSTAYKVFRETCSALWKALQPIYLQALTKETMMQISEDFFNRWQFRNCVGAIDGKHVSIQCPPKKKLALSFTALTRKDFLDLKVMEVWQIVLSARLSMQVKLTFLFQRRFPIFNYRLSRGRCTIENAFGIMSSSWRILRRDLCCTPEAAEDIVKAIVCFHNFLMISEDELAPLERTYCPASMLDREKVDRNVIEGDWRRDIYRRPITNVGRLGSNNPTVRADAQRNILKDYFCSDIGQLDWQWEQALRAYNVNPI